MNDAAEWWSTPWHALQRSLANGFGADETTPGALRPPLGNRVAAQTSGSWLMRARRVAPRAFVQRAD